MPFEGRQRAAVLDRCWSIYLTIARAFNVPDDFHVDFPSTVESALITDTLHFSVPIGGGLTLSLREEYAFDRQKLVVSRYSYNLIIEATDNNILRADNSPFHHTDYRKRPLIRSFRSPGVGVNHCQAITHDAPANGSSMRVGVRVRLA